MALPSLGQLRYLSALQYVDAVVGNSSSGILEVPSFGKPTLNIGNRQKGRIAAGSVVNCGIGKEEIESGLKEVLFKTEPLSFKNPYEKIGTADQILQVIKSYPLSDLIRKSFYNL